MTHVTVRAIVAGIWRFDLCDFETDGDIFDFRQLVVRADLYGESARVLAEALADSPPNYVNFEITIRRGSDGT